MIYVSGSVAGASAVSAPFELNSYGKIGHSVVHKLLAQFCELISLGILKRRLHGGGCGSGLATLLCRLPKKVATVVLIPMLADDAARAEVSN